MNGLAWGLQWRSPHTPPRGRSPCPRLCETPWVAAGLSAQLGAGGWLGAGAGRGTAGCGLSAGLCGAVSAFYSFAVVRAPFPLTDGDRAAVIAQLAKLFGNPGPEVGWLPREQPWPAD